MVLFLENLWACFDQFLDQTEIKWFGAVSNKGCLWEKFIYTFKEYFTIDKFQPYIITIIYMYSRHKVVYHIYANWERRNLQHLIEIQSHVLNFKITT
jgi:hypothetical protein